MKKIEVTHFLDHKEKNEIPFVLPVATTYKKEFSNFSQKSRYEKIKQKLLELKIVMEGDEDNEIKIVKEFLLKNGIVDESAYSLDRINNFIRFVKSDMSGLTMNLSLQQVIEFAGFGYFEKKSLNEKKTNQTHKPQANLQHSKDPQKYREKPYKGLSYVNSLSNFEQSKKFNNKLEEKELIEKLTKEFDDPKFLFDNKRDQFPRSKSYVNTFLLDQSKITKDGNILTTEFDKFSDIDKIKKNNKLLELIVLQRAKTKLLLEEHANNEKINLSELKF